MSAASTDIYHLCIIEMTVDITTNKGQPQGTLCLSRVSDSYIFHWSPIDSTPAQYVSAVFQSIEIPKDDDSKWESGAAFKFNCNLTSLIQLSENPLTITIKRSDQTAARKFLVPDSEFISLAQLIEQLLVNGISVPGSDNEYSLQFYSKCHRGVYTYTPPHIQLSIRHFTNLANFWTDVHQFFQTLLSHLDASDTLPKDPSFPLAAAARASHARLRARIDKDIQNVPSYDRITPDNFDQLFDEHGKIIDPKLFKLRVYHAGVDEVLLNKVIPFAFGLYPMDSTQEEREKLDKVLLEDFNALLHQVKLTDKEQIKRNKRINDAYRVIKHDVSRTDRQTSTFKNLKAPGPKMLTRFLKSYCLYNPPISYLQGMNDLFVPIILSFLPHWNDEGIPIDSNGEPVEYEPYMYKIFWCFEAMLKNIEHLTLLAKVTENCQRQAIRIHQILTSVSPIAAIWMRRRGLKELLWIYSDFVLLFKRTFPNIWPVWLQFNCAPAPADWMAYYVCAILIATFDQLSALPDVSIASMMDAFPKIMNQVETEKIGQIALWLFNESPLIDEMKPEIPTVQTEFDFFETKWTKEKCASQ